MKNYWLIMKTCSLCFHKPFFVMVYYLIILILIYMSGVIISARCYNIVSVRALQKK